MYISNFLSSKRALALLSIITVSAIGAACSDGVPVATSPSAVVRQEPPTEADVDELSAAIVGLAESVPQSRLFQTGDPSGTATVFDVALALGFAQGLDLPGSVIFANDLLSETLSAPVALNDIAPGTTPELVAAFAAPNTVPVTLNDVAVLLALVSGATTDENIALFVNEFEFPGEPTLTASDVATPTTLPSPEPSTSPSPGPSTSPSPGPSTSPSPSPSPSAPPFPMPQPGQSTTVFVDPTFTGIGFGTETAPFKTVRAAVEFANDLQDTTNGIADVALTINVVKPGAELIGSTDLDFGAAGSIKGSGTRTLTSVSGFSLELDGTGDVIVGESVSLTSTDISITGASELQLAAKAVLSGPATVTLNNAAAQVQVTGAGVKVSGSTFVCTNAVDAGCIDVAANDLVLTSVNIRTEAPAATATVGLGGNTSTGIKFTGGIVDVSASTGAEGSTGIFAGAVVTVSDVTFNVLKGGSTTRNLGISSDNIKSVVTKSVFTVSEKATGILVGSTAVSTDANSAVITGSTFTASPSGASDSFAAEIKQAIDAAPVTTYVNAASNNTFTGFLPNTFDLTAP